MWLTGQLSTGRPNVSKVVVSYQKKIKLMLINSTNFILVITMHVECFTNTNKQIPLNHPPLPPTHPLTLIYGKQKQKCRQTLNNNLNKLKGIENFYLQLN